jgi:hypothetical protein
MLSANELAPVFFTVTLWAVLDRLVTRTGVEKLSDVAETVRLGLAELPVTLAGGRVVPVRRTLTPLSSERVAASWLGELDGEYVRVN